MSHLTVSFEESTDNRSRSSSASKPTPHSPDQGGQPSKPILYPIEPSTKKKTFHLPLGSPCSPNGSRPSSPRLPDLSDPERQPLLKSTEANRRRAAIPIVLMVFLIIIGLVIGGYVLGQGEGSDRWPGGPH